MKIEKLNENQIRCILDKSDLEARELQLSELAYGSAKARELFRDMMETAANEFGFEADNIPLMIEAIPVSKDCLILVVTKVEDPEELDTRFSRFSSLLQEEDMDMDEMDILEEDGTVLDEDIDFDDDANVEKLLSEENTTVPSDDPELEEVFDLMAPFNKAIAKAKQELRKKQAELDYKPLSDHVYAFARFDDAVNVCTEIAQFYLGESVLYKDAAEGVYYLLLRYDSLHEDLYKAACTTCSDYGEAIAANYAAIAYFEEHFQKIIDEDAVYTLYQLSR